MNSRTTYVRLSGQQHTLKPTLLCRLRSLRRTIMFCSRKSAVFETLSSECDDMSDDHLVEAEASASSLEREDPILISSSVTELYVSASRGVEGRTKRSRCSSPQPLAWHDGDQREYITAATRQQWTVLKVSDNWMRKILRELWLR
jgi:hypothetical protein